MSLVFSLTRARVSLTTARVQFITELMRAKCSRGRVGCPCKQEDVGELVGGHTCREVVGQCRQAGGS